MCDATSPFTPAEWSFMATPRLAKGAQGGSFQELQFGAGLGPKEIENKFTLLQKADYLTKPLPPISFQQNWFLSIGW